MLGEMNNRVTFYKKSKSGPEAFSESLVEVYSCFCDEYNPTITDKQILDLDTNKNSISLKIRRNRKGPDILNTFVFSLETGYFKNETFEIISISPDYHDDEFIKITGQGIGDE